ncbi:thioredoxin family protein [Streptomyces mirabilis]
MERPDQLLQRLHRHPERVPRTGYAAPLTTAAQRLSHSATQPLSHSATQHDEGGPGHAHRGPCRAISPILDQIAAEHPDKITLVKVNVDDNPATTAEHQITSIPTLKVYRDGVVRKTVTGAMPKPVLERKLREFLRG